MDCYPVSKQINSVRFDEAEYAKKVDLEYLGLLRNETSNQERVCVSEAGLEVVVPVQR